LAGLRPKRDEKLIKPSLRELERSHGREIRQVGELVTALGALGIFEMDSLLAGGTGKQLHGIGSLLLRILKLASTNPQT